LVEERKIGDDKMVFVEECKSPTAVSILIRAGLERMVEEAERAMNDAISVVTDVVQTPMIVAGGGALELELSRSLKTLAVKTGGREQLAIEAFSNALEVIPRTLAENAGHDPLDVMVALRSAHEKENGAFIGIDISTGKPADMRSLGIYDPLKVKEQAVKTATELASMLLRIDDVIAASKPKEEEKPKPPSPEGEEEY
ncbi:MAG: TCP-1/cpn60 chaperonin family protein, partial [Candidatus Bathyarchaeia archaeon]